MRRSWLLFALAFLPACSCGTKNHTTQTSGIVVLSIDGKDLTEADGALPFNDACVANPDIPPVAKSFLIKNSGQSPLKLVSVTIEGANKASFTLTSTIPASVDPHGQTEVDLQFAPASTGNQAATVVVVTDDPNKGTVNVRLTGQGRNLPSQPTYSTACEDASGTPTGDDACTFFYFPDTSAGATATKPVHITNNGCSPLKVTDVAINGDTFADGGSVFRVHGSAPSSGSPLVINTGETADLSLDFLPGANTTYVADVFVTTNGQFLDGTTHSGLLPDGGDLPPQIFYLGVSGTGTAAQVVLTPASCDFNQTDGGQSCGAHDLGNGQVAATFTVQNVGNVSVQVTDVTIPGDTGAFTVQTAGLPLTLGISGSGTESSTLTVTYHPTPAPVSEHLTVTTSAGTLSSLLIGGNPPVIVVPTFVSFNNGTTDPNQFFSPQQVTVGNGGTGPLTVTAASFLQGLDDGGTTSCAARFAIDPASAFNDGGLASFPFDVQPGDSTTLLVAHNRDINIGGTVDCELHLANTDPSQADALIRLEATTLFNLAPIAVLSPDDGEVDGGLLTVSVSVDGGVLPLSGAGSADCFDGAPGPQFAGCTNGNNDGLQSFHWTLTGDPSFTYASHLEDLASTDPNNILATCNHSNAGGCDDLLVTTAQPNNPGNAALVNLVVAGADQGKPPFTVSLSVVDTTGKVSNPPDQLTVAPGQ